MARSDHPATGDVPGRGGARGVRDSVVLVAVGVVLLGVAAWSASRASVGDSSPDIPANTPNSDAALNDALLVAAGALAAAIVIFVAPAFVRQGRGRAMAGDDEPRRPQLWLRLVVGVIFMFAVVLVIMLASRNRPDQVQPLPVAPPTTEQVQREAGTRAGAHGWAAVALATAGAIAVSTAVVVWRRRGRFRGPFLDTFDREVLPPGGPVDFDELSPADAVRAAYAAARRAIEPIGVPTRPPETPYEYLDRVYAAAPNVARPVATLTRLFEVARFSHHPVTPAMKAEAIAAYRTVLDEATRAREAAVVA